MPNQLLVPLDGSTLADAVLPHAVALAKRLKVGLALVRVHQPLTTLSGPPEVGPIFLDVELEEQLRDDDRRWLDQRVTALRASSGIAVTGEFRIGPLADTIVEVAADLAVLAIVCSTHGSGGWAPNWLGSVTDAVVRHAPCPVIALSEAAVKRDPEVRSLLVLTDGSALAEDVVPYATWFARAYGASVELLQVVSPPWPGDGLMLASEGPQDRFGINALAAGAKETLADLCEHFTRNGISASSTVEVEINAARTILDHIHRTNPDAVAVATHGRGLSRLMLGSIADKVLRTGGRPTLIVPPSVRHGLGRANAAGERELAHH